MKANQNLALALLGGISIASAGAQVIHDHPIKTPTVSLILGASVTYPGSGYPCGCHDAEQSGDQGKSARKPHPPQRPADIARRPRVDQTTRKREPKSRRLYESSPRIARALEAMRISSKG
jgi:hypothetical protein